MRSIVIATVHVLVERHLKQTIDDSVQTLAKKIWSTMVAWPVGDLVETKIKSVDYAQCKTDFISLRFKLLSICNKQLNDQ